MKVTSNKFREAARRLARRGIRAADSGVEWLEGATGADIPWRSQDVIRIVRHPDRARRSIEALLRGQVYRGRRSHIDRAQGVIRKEFEDSATGLQALQNEVEAQRLFDGAPWKLPISNVGARSFEMPEFAKDARLDRAARRMTLVERRDAAAQAIGVVLDFTVKGVAHRDFHAQNAYWVEGQLLVGDFETMTSTPCRRLAEAYDLVGAGLMSPNDTRSMCYAHPAPMSLGSALGVSLEEAVEAERGVLKAELQAACQSFQGRKRAGAGQRRHECKTDRVYGSFSLPGFEIAPDEAQRDSQKRFARFGATKEHFLGKRMLDLGCNVGAMSFAAQAFGPATTLGIEYDIEKVAMAQKIAVWTGVADRAVFRQGDVDTLNHEIGLFDVVLCLAIESHVANPSHLYELLGQVCVGTLFFEGNAGCDRQGVVEALQREGFDVAFVGDCDDDARPENNTRPMWVCTKSRT